MTLLTEDQIESRIERMMDHLDRLLLNRDMPQTDYDLAVKDLQTWAEARYRELRNSSRVEFE